MIKIKLFCAAGMSTSLLVEKMKKAAEKNNIEAEISAYPETELELQIQGLDVALLGPQMSYKLAADRKICEAAGVAIDVVPMADYGMMNGEKVLQFAIDLKNKKG